MTSDQQVSTPVFDIWLDRALADLYDDVVTEEIPGDMLDLLREPPKLH
jgi:hypothetical protein